MRSGSPVAITRNEPQWHWPIRSIGLLPSTAFPNFHSYGSCGGIDLVVPSVNDRVAVQIIDELQDALFEFVFRADADVAEHGAGGFGEEALDEIEPGAVLGREHELKAPLGSRRQPSLGLPRDDNGAEACPDISHGRLNRHARERY